jgi:hypothetical protein
LLRIAELTAARLGVSTRPSPLVSRRRHHQHTEQNDQRQHRETMDVHKKMLVKKLKALYKIVEHQNPRLHLSLTIRYADELKRPDHTIIELKMPEDVGRFIKAGEHMTEAERHKAGIDRLLTTNEHLAQPSEYNPIKTLGELRKLLKSGYVRKPESPRCAVWDACVFQELQVQGFVIQLTIDDFRWAADEVWGPAKASADKAVSNVCRRACWSCLTKNRSNLKDESFYLRRKSIIHPSEVRCDITRSTRTACTDSKHQQCASSTQTASCGPE